MQPPLACTTQAPFAGRFRIIDENWNDIAALCGCGKSRVIMESQILPK